MKTKILSLVILAALIGSATLASANSDVPDNMMSAQARSAVDILTKTAKGPWDECTIEELKESRCSKNLAPMSQLVQNATLSNNEVLQVRVLTDACQNSVEIETPEHRRVRVNESEKFDISGRYLIINNAPQTCRLMLKQFVNP